MRIPTTLVTFPDGSVTGRSTVLAVHRLADGRFGAVTESTPFHPLDHTWPDQPADTGTLAGLRVVDCLTAAMGPDSPGILVGADIATSDGGPVRRGDANWSWLALHVTEEDPSSLVGTEVELAVDAPRRAALSAAHTGCHLLALALNAALAGRWRKDPGRGDAFGNPDFDSLAMDASRIGEDASTDVYRLGKSLRKKGFRAEGLADALPAVTDAINQRLAGWIAADAPVRIDVPGPELTAHRSWTCALPEAADVAISCGGTHLTRLGELSALTAELTLSADGTRLTAVTTPKLR